MTTKETRTAQYHELIRKASTDLEFRKALLEDPKAVLTAEGWQLPEAMEVRVVENTEELMYVTLPALSLLTDEKMEQIAAGSVSYASLLGRISTVSKVSAAPE